MKVIGLDGKTATLKVDSSNINYIVRSELHLQVRELLHKIFPVDFIYEELGIPGSKLTIDFFLPQRRLAVECHGEQHYRYIPFFHQLPSGFTASQYRDTQKSEWCKRNNIKLAIIPYNSDPDDWTKIIKAGRC